MGSVNKWIGVGRLGADPELKYTPSGKAVCNLRIACDEMRGKGETRKEHVEWVRVTAWETTAENCGKFLRKGQQVYVEGRLQTRSYDKDGQKHFATDVVADRVVFLGSRQGGDESAGKGETPADGQTPRKSHGIASQAHPAAGDDDDDLNF